MVWKAFIEKKPWNGTENLRIIRTKNNGYDLVQPFVFKSYEQFAAAPEDEIALGGSSWMTEGDVRGFLQTMMDLAWQEGIRPVAIEDQRNELKAVREHLADMRTLALPQSE